MDTDSNSATPAGDRLETVSTSQFPFPSKSPKPEAPSRPPRVSVSVQTETVPDSLPPQEQIEQSPVLLSSLEASVAQHPPTQSESNANFFPLDLPSKFLFYRFKGTSVSAIRGKHQAKFASAAKRKDTRLSVEAVTSLLGDGVSAAELTVPDFFFVLYWLRLNSSSSSPMRVRAPCSNPTHVLEVAENQKPLESLYTTTLINSTRLKQSEIDPSVVAEFLQRPEVLLLREAGFNLTAPRMQDSVELEEKWVGKPEYDEVEFLAEFAGSIAPIDGTVLSLEERIAIVGEFETPILSLLRDWQAIVQSYGVEESVTFKCKECGANIDTEVSISASDFL